VSQRELLEDYFGDTVCYDPGQLVNPAGKNFSCIKSIGQAIADINGPAMTAIEMGVSISGTNTSGIDAAIQAAQQADRVVLCLGLDTVNVEHEGLDRKVTTLPGIQEDFAKQILALGKITIIVLVNGGSIAIDDLVEPAAAIVEAFYPATQGADALANILFGNNNRWGKMPYTIYGQNYINEVAMNDMSMTNGKGRTYKYYTGEPLYPFGYGLSYGTFPIRSCSHVSGLYDVECTLCHNTGMPGDEVLLVFHRVSDGIRQSVSALHPVPAKQLVQFERFSLNSVGQCATHRFVLTSDSFALTDATGNRVLYPGDHFIDVTNGADQTQTVTFSF